MADDTQQTIRAINWRELFPFLNLFRAFRVAVHPSKLVLGLAALLAIYLGGRVLDAVWPNAYSALPGEIDRYERYAARTGPAEPFGDTVADERRDREEAYARLLRSRNILTDERASLEAARKGDHFGRLQASRMELRNKNIDDAGKARDERIAAIEKDTSLDARAKDRERAEARSRYEDAVRREMAAARADLRQLDQLVPHGVFEEFFDYQARQVNAVVYSVMANNWTRSAAAEAAAAGPGGRAAVTEADLLGTVGVFPAVRNFLTVGPTWLIRYHWVYALLFVTWFLLMWALFGGAIARIAAVHVARDEKISVRQALRFSASKVLSFVFAPVIPLLIVLGIGLVLAVGGLLFYIPVVGPILAGGLLILALIAGVVITLVLFGTAGGLNLMYPTIAVEGSDSFDAISRSFSYVFARPWRMLFYTAISIAYGAICYLFVKFFIFVTLAAVHFFVGWFLGGQPGRWYPEIWPAPTFASLPYDLNTPGLKWSEDVAAFLIAFWVYLTIGLLGAFAISFYFSASTITYYLMRREVDATEIDDVYIEEADDDLADVGPVTAPGATGTPAAVPVAPAATTTTTAGGAAGTEGPSVIIVRPDDKPADPFPPSGGGNPPPQG